MIMYRYKIQDASAALSAKGLGAHVARDCVVRVPKPDGFRWELVAWGGRCRWRVESGVALPPSPVGYGGQVASRRSPRRFRALSHRGRFGDAIGANFAAFCRLLSASVASRHGKFFRRERMVDGDGRVLTEGRYSVSAPPRVRVSSRRLLRAENAGTRTALYRLLSAFIAFYRFAPRKFFLREPEMGRMGLIGRMCRIRRTLRSNFTQGIRLNTDKYAYSWKLFLKTGRDKESPCPDLTPEAVGRERS
jgi:hypothetical protein